MKYKIKDSSVAECKKEFCEILDELSTFIKEMDLNNEGEVMKLLSKFEEIHYVDRSLVTILAKISEDETGHFEEVIE